MRSLLKYTNTFMLALQASIEYRIDFILSIISGLFIVIVQCSLWTAVFNSSNSMVIYGYTYQEMMIYSIFSGIVSKLVATGFENEIADDIKSGGLSKYITQPMNYKYYRFCKFVGGKVMQMLIVTLLLFISMLFFVFKWSFQIDAFSIITFFISIVLGLVLNFCIFFLVSQLAFRMTEVWGVFIAVNQGSYLLSGGVFPLDVFGENVYRIVHLLPFEYTVFFQINIINGHLEKHQILDGLLIQLIWILILSALGEVCWKKGLKKYVAVGN